MGSLSQYLSQKTTQFAIPLKMSEKLENFEEFLTETGVGLVARKMMASTKPAIEITKDGEKWAITFKVMIKSNTISFEVGKEFSEENPVLGEKGKVIAENIEGNLRLKTTNEKTGLVVMRTFCPTDEGFTMTMKAEGKSVEAKRIFKRTA